MNWFLLVIISAISNSFARILQKVLLNDKENHPAAFAFVFQITVSLIMLVWALIEGFKIPNLIPLLPFVIAMALLYALANLSLFKAFKSAEASVTTILLSSSTIWSVLSAIVLLGEKLTLVKLIATILVFLGVATVYYSKSKWKLNLSHLFALLSGILFGIAFTNDAFLVGKFESVSSYMFIAFLLLAFAILIFQPKAVKHLKHFVNKDVIVKLILTCLFYGIAAVTVFQAYKNGGEASVISPIAQTSVLMTVLIGYVLLKERDRLLNKIIGSLLVISGVWLLR